MPLPFILPAEPFLTAPDLDWYPSPLCHHPHGLHAEEAGACCDPRTTLPTSRSKPPQQRERHLPIFFPSTKRLYDHSIWIWCILEGPREEGPSTTKSNVRSCGHGGNDGDDEGEYDDDYSTDFDYGVDQCILQWFRYQWVVLVVVVCKGFADHMQFGCLSLSPSSLKACCNLAWQREIWTLNGCPLSRGMSCVFLVCSRYSIIFLEATMVSTYLPTKEFPDWSFVAASQQQQQMGQMAPGAGAGMFGPGNEPHKQYQAEAENIAVVAHQYILNGVEQRLLESVAVWGRNG